MKNKKYITWILLSLVTVLIVSFVLIRTTADCLLHVYYINEAGTTIQLSKTYSGKWFSQVQVSTRIPGYKLETNVKSKQRLSLKGKNIVLKYKVARSKKQIMAEIRKAKYVGASVQLMNSNRLKNKQEDPVGAPAYLRVVTSKDGKTWKSQALDYPNINVRNPRIYHTGHYWLVLSDNMIMSTTNFVNWNANVWKLSQKKYAGIYNPNLIKWAGSTYIIYQSWTNNDNSNKKIYYSQYNSANASLSKPQQLSISKKARKLDGFVIKLINGKLVLLGVDTSKNKIVEYTSDNLMGNFSKVELKQSISVDNLSSLGLSVIGNKKYLYYSSFRIAGGAEWRNNVQFTQFSANQINFKNAKPIRSDILSGSLSVADQ